MIVGIDLGTTNSLVSVWRDGEAQLIPNPMGHVLTPSVVSIGEDGELLVGLAARERLVTHPAQSAAMFKRQMGAGTVRTLGSHDLPPEDLSALVLGALKRDAETYLGEPVTEAIITVPAYFNDLQRKATQTAGVLAGLDVKRLLSEPTAAALAYGATAGPEEQSILVVDIGGGTFDVSLLHCFEGLMEVRATAGDSWLGGEDFVDVLVAAFMAEAGAAAGLPPISRPAAVHGAVRRQAEIAKRRLSEADEALIRVVHEGAEVSWRLDRARFEQLSEPVLARVRAPIERAIRDSKADPDTLSQVILVGGASRMPMFRRLIGRLFKRLPNQQINPDEVVARGAAVRAGMMTKDAALEEVFLTDVSPFTLGIEVSDTRRGVVDGLFLPIIERNTVIPASRAQPVVNTADGQTGMGLNVYQGESRLTAENVLLGALNVHFPPASAGQATVDVRFTYDASGLLEVESTVASTGVRTRLVIESRAGSQTPEEIEARLALLAGLKAPPREKAENLAAIARANRLYAQRLGGERALIGDALAAFLGVIQSQDPVRGRAALAQLNQLLDRLDDTVFL